ncbi:MAG: hypothetical protein ACRD3J_31795 [Thermoanaerobaculia bacterium]
MFAIRLALIASLLYSFAAIVHEGPIVDPNGGRPRLTNQDTPDHRCTIDPNGGCQTSSAFRSDLILGVDPNG